MEELWAPKSSTHSASPGMEKKQRGKRRRRHFERLPRQTATAAKPPWFADNGVPSTFFAPRAMLRLFSLRGPLGPQTDGNPPRGVVVSQLPRRRAAAPQRTSTNQNTRSRSAHSRPLKPTRASTPLVMDGWIRLNPFDRASDCATYRVLFLFSISILLGSGY